jgi:hypothetical protein
MVFHKNKKTDLSIENQQEVVYVEKLPFSLSGSLKNYRNVVKPGFKKTLVAMISVVVLFIVFTGIFWVFDLIEINSVENFFKSISLFSVFNSIFTLIGFLIILFIITLIITKQTPDLTSNYVTGSKFSGIFQVVSIVLVITFLILAAGFNV